MKIGEKILELMENKKINYLGVDFELFGGDFIRVQDYEPFENIIYSCDINNLGDTPVYIMDMDYEDFQVWKHGLVNGTFCIEFILHKKEGEKNETI